MAFVKHGICVGLVVMVVVADLTAPFCAGLTDPRDVAAMNSIYLSLGSPPLDKWMPSGGDPCGDSWQGVSCVFSNVTEIKLNGMNLGGVLSESLGDFESIIVIDFSNNHIGGGIPSNLPLTIRNFSLSGNQLTGSIPASLSTLSQLLELSLNNNLLIREIPDAFQHLTSLIYLDLSANNLSGQLPPSVGNLSALGTLHLQNNTLTGVLDVLQDIHLSDLNIENNLFSGPIPPKLLTVPNFRKDGNPFNTTVIPPPPTAQPPYIAWAPTPIEAPISSADYPPASNYYMPTSAGANKFELTKGIIFIAIAVGVILVILGLILFIWRYCKNRRRRRDVERNYGENVYEDPKEMVNYNKSSVQLSYGTEKAFKDAVVASQERYGVDSRRIGRSLKRMDEQPPAPSLSHPVAEKVTVNPVAPLALTSNPPEANLISCPVDTFTIASLQEYTDSFSDDNFIGQGMLGTVYKAELPDGKLLAVKKLNATVSRWLTDEEFSGLVTTISRLQHANIVQLVGYCNEFSQRLLVYEFCENGTLYDMLHLDEDPHKKLTWNVRIRVALGAARALQYLHEGCQPPIVHRNFKSANILLDQKFTVHVSDCGLAPILSAGSTSELSGRLLTANGYAAPEFDSGSYTCQSDVYSLGVVMLELLTGRKSYDRSRPRGEHSLVRWAIPQLHDIDALSRMVDPSLKGAYPAKSLSRFADIIARCVQWEPGFRLPVSEVVQDLLHMI